MTLELTVRIVISTYFDDVRITRARTEDYVMALRDSTRDNTGHVDLHMARGLPGILFGNVITEEEKIRSLRTSGSYCNTL